MANDVGYIRQEDIPAFKLWLDQKAVGWNPGVGLWEVLRIHYGALTCIITRNKVEQYKTPVELRPLLLEFREFINSHEQVTETPEEITDTERLDFMLSKARNVVVEVAGWGSEGSHYEVYVEEGVMGDRQYDAVRFTQQNFKGGSDEGRKIKREAIDLAIIQSRSETSEESN